MTIRAALVEKGILPTPEQAKNAYWRLKDQWWRQIIDGQFHKWGKRVFDAGLHGKEIEPGYLHGILEASHLFTDRIEEDFNLDLYRAVHHAACEHFKGKENNTLCNASEIDDFRSRIVAATERVNSIKCDDFEMEYWSARDNFSNIATLTQRSEDEILEELDDELERYQSRLPKYAAEIQKKIEGYFASVQEHLSLKAPLTTCEITWDNIHFHFRYMVPKEKMENIVNAFINKYNGQLHRAQQIAYAKLNAPNADHKAIKTEYQASAQREIARLYAHLEWSHPWIDGQGRTDLIAVLNGQLCREGLHPCILEYPYYSTSSTLEDWDAYLERGLKKYEEFCATLKL